MNTIKIYRFIMNIYGWLLVRPRRWFFWKMVANSYLRLTIKHEDYFGWSFPNFHWWLLYKTVFRFFKWLDYDAWRIFCNWKGGYRRTYPLIARVIHRIGATTAGYAISGFECYHCGSPDGCQAELSADETGTMFKLEKTWIDSTPDGDDHCFRGITICPDCGYEAEYQDGSL